MCEASRKMRALFSITSTIGARGFSASASGRSVNFSLARSRTNAAFPGVVTIVTPSAMYGRTPIP